MTQHPDLFASLAAPFDPHEVKVRSQSGRQLHYVTARTVMNRLDSVLGPENWWDEYIPSESSVLCRLTVRLPDNSTLTKSDAGGYAGMADSGDDDKSGYSDAFKRAAVKFGVARYLYRDGVPGFVQERSPSATVALTSVAPAAEPGPVVEAAQPPYHNASGAPQVAGTSPRSGRALFAWTKDQGQRFEVDLLRYLNQWAKLQDFPGRMIDWNPDQVHMAHQEACRKLASVPAANRDAYEEALSN